MSAFIRANSFLEIFVDVIKIQKYFSSFLLITYYI